MTSALPAEPAAAVDPRPLVGEPVSLDLLNTVWIDAAGRHDLLADLAGLRIWLASNALAERVPASEDTRLALLQARNVISEHLDDPSARTTQALNALLARGVLIRTLTEHGPATRPQMQDPAQLAAWTAAEDYLQLLARDPARVRRCAHPDCVLHFYDTSPRGDRRWCSMAGCGNRAKAARHHARTRQHAS